jgi:hypothetical protein
MMMMKELTDKESFEIIKPICRELYELIEKDHIQFVSGTLNESNGTYKINIKSNRLHFATKGLKNSIGDIEYKDGKIRVGIRANNIPVNVFVDII